MEKARQPKALMIQIVDPIMWAQVWEHNFKHNEDNLQKFKWN